MAEIEELTLATAAEALTLSVSPAAIPYDRQPFYEYKPLVRPLDTFRLLELQPLDDDEVVRGTLNDSELDSAVPYLAISYEWGNGDACQTIQVDDTYFRVRTNLFDCLMEFSRRIYRPSKVFVDAVCIDQSSREERNAQVRSMGRIYRQAWEVFVWLGREISGSDALFHLAEFRAKYNNRWIEQFASVSLPAGIATTEAAIDLGALQCSDMSHYRYPWKAGTVCMATTLPTGETLYQIPFSSYVWSTNSGDHLQCVSCLTMAFIKATQSYWSRAWIVQENVLARQATLNCGSLSIKWERLAAVLRDFSEVKKAPADFREFPIEHSGFSRVGELKQEDDLKLGMGRDELLLEVLIKSMKRQGCADPRDRVYSVLGLLRQGDAFNVDYSQSKLQVLLSALDFCHMLTERKSLFSREHVRPLQEALELGAVTDAAYIGAEIKALGLKDQLLLPEPRTILNPWIFKTYLTSSEYSFARIDRRLNHFTGLLGKLSYWVTLAPLARGNDRTCVVASSGSPKQPGTYLGIETSYIYEREPKSGAGDKYVYCFTGRAKRWSRGFDDLAQAMEHLDEDDATSTILRRTPLLIEPRRLYDSDDNVVATLNLNIVDLMSLYFLGFEEPIHWSSLDTSPTAPEWYVRAQKTLREEESYREG